MKSFVMALVLVCANMLLIGVGLVMFGEYPVAGLLIMGTGVCLWQWGSTLPG